MTENVLTRNQRKALVALLENITISDAAEACGLSEKTIHRYLTDQEFRKVMLEVESGLIEAAGQNFTSGSDWNWLCYECLLEASW